MRAAAPRGTRIWEAMALQARGNQPKCRLELKSGGHKQRTISIEAAAPIARVTHVPTLLDTSRSACLAAVPPPRLGARGLQVPSRDPAPQMSGCERTRRNTLQPEARRPDLTGLLSGRQLQVGQRMFTQRHMSVHCGPTLFSVTRHAACRQRRASHRESHKCKVSARPMNTRCAQDTLPGTPQATGCRDAARRLPSIYTHPIRNVFWIPGQGPHPSWPLVDLNMSMATVPAADYSTTRSKT